MDCVFGEAGRSQFEPFDCATGGRQIEPLFGVRPARQFEPFCGSRSLSRIRTVGSLGRAVALRTLSPRPWVPSTCFLCFASSSASAAELADAPERADVCLSVPFGAVARPVILSVRPLAPSRRVAMGVRTEPDLCRDHGRKGHSRFVVGGLTSARRTARRREAAVIDSNPSSAEGRCGPFEPLFGGTGPVWWLARPL